MKKILVLTIAAIVAVFLLIYAFIYFVPYSEGVRSGELIKISRKGVLTKTWEGEISQGISGGICKTGIRGAVCHFFLAGRHQILRYQGRKGAITPF